MRYASWFLNFDPPGTGDDAHWWQGGEYVTIGTITYAPLTVNKFCPIELSNYTNSLEPGDQRIQGRMMLNSDALTTLYPILLKTIKVRVGDLVSTDGGYTWRRLNPVFGGVIDSMTIDEDLMMSFEIIKHNQDFRRGSKLLFSDERQKKRYPGDRALEYKKELSKGAKIRWPT